MSETILLKGRHNLIEEIIKPFDLSKTDFSDTLVIFPGKRPPHFLKKAIAQKTGKPFNPPQTFSMDVFIDYIYREKLRRKNKDLEPCDAVAVIFDLYQNSKLKLNDRHFNTFDRFLPIAFNLLNALEELCIEKIPFNAPMTACSAEPQILMSLYKPFYDYLNKHVYCTRASRYAVVAEQAGQADWTEYAKIIMAGFYIFTRSETELIRALLKQPHVTMYFQDGPGIDETLRLLKIKPQNIEGESLEPEVRIYQTADAHEEIFRMNSLLNGISNNELCTERNAIVLPNRDNLFPILRHTLCRYNDNEYNISMGYPVTRTPLFGFLNIMLDVLTGQWNERFSAKDYLRFLLHPYIKNTLSNQRTDVTRILCHTVEEEFFKDQSKIYFTLDELEKDESLFGKVIQRIRNIDAVISADELKAILKNIHQNTIGRFIGIESIAGFAEQCISVMEFLNHQTTAPRHPFFNPFATPVINALEKLKTGLIGKEKFSDLQAYRRFLNYYLQTEEVAFTGTPLKGLQVLGLLETRSIQFDHVFILDVNENTLPSSSETDVFLPPGTRKSMNLPTREQHDRIIKYYYSLLTQQARQVHLYYVNNDDQQRSRFIEEYLWQKQKESDKTDIENQFIEKISGTFRLDQSLPPPIVKNESMASILKNIEYSATTLDTYLKCGLKFYYRLVLKLYEKESLDEDIDALSIGELVHRILENYFLNKMNVTLSENHLNSKELEECIDRQFTARFGQQDSGELLLMKQQIKNHLNDFINHYQSDVIKSAGTTITELETKINVVFHDYQLKGKIDRVERRDDRIYLIDYKTSGDKKGFISELSKFNPDDRKSWLKPLQLAFYWILFAEKNNISPATIYPLFLLLGCKTIDSEIEISLNDQSQNTIERYEIFKNMILNLLQEINDLAINFHPPEKANDHCPDCEFNNICGMQWAKKGY